MAQFKSQAHARELKQRLSLLVSGLSISENVDSNGMESLKLVKGSETIFIKIDVSDNAGRVDGLGLPQRVYSPHICKILRGDTPSDLALREIVVAACAKLGMKLEIYEIATLPSSFDLTGANLIVSIPSDEIHGLTLSQ
jgi:hypothetical protein